MVVPVDRPDPAAAMWENLPVDTELGPLETTISDHDVKSYGYAVDDFHPWYMHHSPFGGRVVPPALLSVALFKLRHLPGNFALMHGLHTREELQLFRAVRLGEPLTLRARVTDKFTKRGERFIVVSGQVSDDRDLPLLRTRETQLLRKNVERIVGRPTARPTEHVVNDAIADGARFAAACPSAETGAMLPALTKHVTFEQMTVFSFGPRTIHTDREVAIESGLAGPIAQGLMSTCYLSEMLVSFFGAAWFDSGWTSHAFIKPVASGDTLTVHGRIRDTQVETGGTRVLLDVWCRNQAEELTTVGSAGALVNSGDFCSVRSGA